MKRILLSISCLGVLMLGACNTASTDTDSDSTTATENTTDMVSSDSAATSEAAMTDAAGATAPHATDAEFMQSAAHSDQNEIQLSKLALDKGITGMAKDHANKMITDHTKSTADLKPIAQKKGVTLPTDMDPEHKTIAEQMGTLSGKDLEKKYLEQMAMDHQKTVNTMVAHQKMTQDADLQGFITKTLPVVQTHLAMFKQHAGM
ncbi:DUF4142 domain-containing protein [Hymenobacter swuensis]|nr:DUF4142 domain-containing protein [Hymenobacter swuensis]